MPLKRQQTAAQLQPQDVGRDGTAYVPPPYAYPDRQRESAPPKQQSSRTMEVVQGAQSAWEQLRARSQRVAEERTKRAQERAQERAERAMQRTLRTEQALERTQTPQQVQKPPRTQTAPRTVVTFEASGVGWRQQLYVYGVLLIVGYGVWFLDGAFTVIGAVTTLLPATVIGVAIALAGHFFVSWGQHTLVFHPHLAIKLLGLLLLAVNAMSNIYGITSAAQTLRPGLLGTLPDDPGIWLQQLIAWIGGQTYGAVVEGAPEAKPPTWIITAIIVLALAIALAWFAEKIRDYFHAQWQAVWALRP